MHAFSISVVASYALSIALGMFGAVQLAGIDVTHRAYLRWGYSPRAYRLNGVLELTAAVLIVTTNLHWIGFALAVATNFVTVVLLLGNGAYLLALPGLAMAAAMPLTLLPTH